MADRRPRVGQIDFLNCLPIAWGFHAIGADSSVELHADTPDVLSDMLVAGQLDVAPISTVEALNHADDLVVLPEVSVGADGPVLSVCLVGAPPEQLDGATVSLGSTSRTSVVLAQMLLERRWGVQPKYRSDPPDLPVMLSHADAAVLIGDPALSASLVEGPAQGWTVTDLAQAWREWTGLPMVFAVWAARREFAQERGSELERLRQGLAGAVAHAAEHRTEVVAAAVARSGLPAPALEAYFAALQFGLDERQRAGLASFAQSYANYRSVSTPAELRILDPITETPVKTGDSGI